MLLKLSIELQHLAALAERKRKEWEMEGLFHVLWGSFLGLRLCNLRAEVVCMCTLKHLESQRILFEAIT